MRWVEREIKENGNTAIYAGKNVKINYRMKAKESMRKLNSQTERKKEIPKDSAYEYIYTVFISFLYPKAITLFDEKNYPAFQR